MQIGGQQRCASMSLVLFSHRFYLLFTHSSILYAHGGLALVARESSAVRSKAELKDVEVGPFYRSSSEGIRIFSEALV